MVSDCVKRWRDRDGENAKKMLNGFRRNSIPVCGLLYPVGPRFTWTVHIFYFSQFYVYFHIWCSCSVLIQHEVMTPTYSHNHTRTPYTLTPITFISHRKVHDIISIAWNQITWVRFSLSLSFFSFRTPSTLVFEILHLQNLFSSWLFRWSWFTGCFPHFSHHIWWLVVYSFPPWSSAITLHTLCECVRAILRYYQNDFPFVSFQRNTVRCVCVCTGAGMLVILSVRLLSLFIFKTFTKFDFDSLPHTHFLSITLRLRFQYLDEFMPQQSAFSCKKNREDGKLEDQMAQLNEKKTEQKNLYAINVLRVVFGKSIYSKKITPHRKVERAHGKMPKQRKRERGTENLVRVKKAAFMAMR